MSTRRLAAIMFADIVGYTAMMQQNEAEGMAKAHHFSEVMEKQVKIYHGEILEFRGDGSLCIFNSAVEAMRCAKDIQQTLKSDVPLRIGIHIGDIVLKNQHIYGDGVNLASRVESMGVPGSILVTERVIHDVKSHPEFEMASLGKFQFKNVEKPMEVFALANEGFIIPKPREIGGKAKSLSQSSKSSFFLKPQIWLPTLMMFLIGIGYIFLVLSLDKKEKKSSIPEKSIAVLPFKNMSNDPEQKYFSDGISEEILYALAGIKDLKVSGRLSAFTLKEQNSSLQEMGRILGVKNILEGSVRKKGNRLRIGVQLINAENGFQIWSELYDREMDDVFAIQEEIALEVVNQLKVNLSLEESDRLRKRYMKDPATYDLYLRATHEGRKLSLDGLAKAKEIYLQIIEKDSTFALAYMNLAYDTFVMGAWIAAVHPDSAKKEALVYLEKALELDPELAEGNLVSGSFSLYWEQDFKKAEKELTKTIEKGFIDAYNIYAELLYKTGKYDQARKQLDTLRQLDPLYPYYYVFSGVVHFLRGDTLKAIQDLEYVVDSHPDMLDAYNKLAKVLLNTGNYQAAIDVSEKGMNHIRHRPPAMLGDLAIAYYKLGNETKKDELLTELMERWKITGVSGSPAFFIAQVYSATGERELAFEWLETSVKHKELELTWLKIEPQFAPLYDDSRFNELLGEVGFPLD